MAVARTGASVISRLLRLWPPSIPSGVGFRRRARRWIPIAFSPMSTRRAFSDREGELGEPVAVSVSGEHVRYLKDAQVVVDVAKGEAVGKLSPHLRDG